MSRDIEEWKVIEKLKLATKRNEILGSRVMKISRGRAI